MSYAGQSKQQQQQDPKTSDIIKEEQNMPGTNVQLEEVNTSPNPVNMDNESDGSLVVPRKKQEQQQKQDKKIRKEKPEKKPVIEDGTVPDETDKYEETQAMKG
jgi:hypothetical protein